MTATSSVRYAPSARVAVRTRPRRTSKLPLGLVDEADHAGGGRSTPVEAVAQRDDLRS